GGAGGKDQRWLGAETAEIVVHLEVHGSGASTEPATSRLTDRSAGSTFPRRALFPRSICPREAFRLDRPDGGPAAAARIHRHRAAHGGLAPLPSGQRRFQAGPRAPSPARDVAAGD